MLRSMQTLGNLPAKNPFSMAASDIAAVRADYERRVWKNRIEQAKIPDKFRHAKLSACCSDVQKWFEDYQNGARGWLLLSGSNGTGKTFSACAIGIQAARNDIVVFATMHEIVNAVQSTFGGSESVEKVLYRFKHASLLIVDELEKFKATEYSANLMFELFNARYASNRPTIITTNLTAKKLFEALSKAASEELAASLMSRLADSRNTSVQLIGEDRRRA